MRRIIAVVDKDIKYGQKLADYINTHDFGGLKAAAFSCVESYVKGSKDYDIRISLVDESEYLRLRESDKKGVVICLSEDCFAGTDNQTINKYSRADLIAQYILSQYAQQSSDTLIRTSINRSHLIMIYSPVSRCGKTDFAITMANVLGQEGKCLLIVLDEYLGVFKYIASEAERDLSDVIYSYKQGKYSWTELIKTVVHFGCHDYIAPVRYPEDLESISTEQLSKLIDVIANESGYENIIVDLGSYGKKAADLLEISNEIYMPVLNDGYSVEKINEFKEALRQSGRSDLINKIKEVEIPFEDKYTRLKIKEEDYSYGKLYEYTRNLFADSIETNADTCGYEDA